MFPKSLRIIFTVIMRRCEKMLVLWTVLLLFGGACTQGVELHDCNQRCSPWWMGRIELCHVATGETFCVGFFNLFNRLHAHDGGAVTEDFSCGACRTNDDDEDTTNPDEVVACPPVGQNIVLSNSLFAVGSTLHVRWDDDNTDHSLCMLSWVGDGNSPEIIPVSRQYNGYPWEATAGPWAGYLSWTCQSDDDSSSSKICTATIPDKPLPRTDDNGGSWQLASFTVPDVYREQSDQVKAARLLEKATFGPTLDEIESFSSPVNWLREQFDTPASSHRALFRRNVGHRFPGSSLHSLVTHPCREGTRYRRYAVTDKDTYGTLVHLEFRQSSGVIFSIEGQIRTVVPDVTNVTGMGWYGYYSEEEAVIFEDGIYPMCSWALDARLGGNLQLQHPGHDDECFYVFFDGNYTGIPPVYFDEETLPTNPLLNLDTHARPIDTGLYSWPPDDNFAGWVQELYLESSLPDDACMAEPDVTNGHRVTVGLFENEYWIHDPRFVLHENTLLQPLEDGGESLVAQTRKTIDGYRKVTCANVPRTFLNEEGCVMVDEDIETCGTTFVNLSAFVVLNKETFADVLATSGRYLYVVDGLRQEMAWVDPPCVLHQSTRWSLVGDDCATDTQVGNMTNEAFADLIRSGLEDSENPSIIDVYSWSEEHHTCNEEDMNSFDFTVQVDGSCWQNVHPHWGEVFDFTDWVLNHPGGPDPIKDFSEKGFILNFPSSHDMIRWHERRWNFQALGKLLDKVTPSGNPNFATMFGSLVDQGNITRTNIVCGSPGEVSNDLSLEGTGSFDLTTPINQTTVSEDFVNQRKSVWIDIALNGKDQLRQRMAWALYQILAVSPVDLDNNDETEKFLVYYDIFVRNAFGSYRQVLKEVAYSPLMAEMLSYLNSKSMALIWRWEKRVQFADENFAREIMQLFSIGLLSLNDDGTPKMENGQTIPTYSNDDIAEYARMWTGFEQQPGRGNVEGASSWGHNVIDPMQIYGLARDPFPKMGLQKTYVGDGIPLCRDLPPRHFLLKGATFRLLGKLPSPVLLHDDTRDFQKEEGTVIRWLTLDETSTLASKLCSGSTLECNPSVLVILDEDIDCSGLECEVESLRVVQVQPGVFYEYTRPACVHQAFFERGHLTRHDLWNFACGDPMTPIASVACCDTEVDYPDISLQVTFDGERVSLDNADERCQAVGLNVCLEHSVEGCRNCGEDIPFWTSKSCEVKAKITPAGHVGIVHAAELTTVPMTDFVRSDTKTYFRVDWSDSLDLNNYDGFCASLGCDRDSFDNFCLCHTRVENSQVFSSAPSRKEVLSNLHIGAFVPTEVSGVDLGNGVTMYSLDDSFTPDTVFEVVDDNGRKHLRKNLASSVYLGSSSTLMFRNPPHFYSLTDPEVRDMHDETEAGLDHLFYHPNVGPFLAIRLAQRFGVSNPSPRFIETITSAFRSGTYTDPSSGEQFGSGEYGNLEATAAALLIDRESTAEVLDADPSYGAILEPFLKVVRTMRSLEFEPSENHPMVSMAYDFNARVGQQCHELPNVFSFFLPEYKPPGAIGRADLVCPECQLLTGSKVVGLVNGLSSLVKYGLDSAYGGFGLDRDGAWEGDRQVGETDAQGFGKLAFQLDDPTDATAVVDVLALLLTSGRLSVKSRSLLSDIFASEAVTSSPEIAALRVQQLMMTTPEFHATGLIPDSEEEVVEEKEVSEPTEPYKAVVFVMLEGGYDSYNVLAPHACDGTNLDGLTLREQYDKERGELAFTDAERTLLIDVDNQPCAQFAVHEDLDTVKGLYDDKDLLFMANVGVIGQGGMTKTDYEFKTPLHLFGHNTMQHETKTVDPFSSVQGTGILGRLASSLKANGYAAHALSIDVPSVAISPESKGGNPVPLIVSSYGIDTFDRKPDEEVFNMIDYMGALNGQRRGYGSLFGETWSEALLSGILDAEFLDKLLTATPLGDHWPDGDFVHHVDTFATVARMIAARIKRGSERDVFYTTLGSWDHHDDMKVRLKEALGYLNNGLSLLVQELKQQDIWDNVTIVITSDFARTITPNSGGGSDHGWGGHYMMMGGSVSGGKVVGKYPNDITINGPLNIDRGRMIPDTSWDAVWNGVCEWMGVDSDDELDYILPNRHASTSGGFSELFGEADLFS